MNYDHAVIAQTVAAGEWFQNIPQQAIEQLASSAHVKRYSANQFIYLIGEQTNHVYCLLSGRVRVSITSSDGQEFALTDLQPGAWFGEASLVGTKPRVQEIWAQDDSDVLLIASKAVIKVATAHPTVYKNLFISHVEQTRQMYLLLAGMLFYPLRSRLAGRLLSLMRKHGEISEQGVVLDMHMSQLDFARMSMGSRQRINKILRDWVKRGVIAKQGDKYVILDVDALRQELELDESD